MLKQVLVEQREGILRKNPGISRTLLAQIDSKILLPHVLVIKGLRRCGKSTLLRQIIQKYCQDSDFFYLNFEDERLIDFQAESFSTILEAQIELFGNKKIFLIDEIQQNQGFETYIRRLSDQGYKFIITGSNANLLSSEISTKLTGRHVDLTLYPFSFNEFLTFKKVGINRDDIYIGPQRAVIKREFDHYLLQGGMPEFLVYQDDEIIFRIFEDIIFKDVAVRNGITMVKPMRELYHYLVSNMCRTFSYRTLTSITDIDSPVTIKNYIHYLEQTFFIRLTSKFDFSLKKQIINNKKVYVIDNAFFQKISFQYSGNKGWLLENLVGIELSKTGDLFYYEDKSSCDFILKNTKGFTAYQVAFEMTKTTSEREIKGLVDAMKYLGLNNGTIITYDDENEVIQNGFKITMIPCWKWLIMNG
jgi:predicted AAA+ superfamily ATPase